MLLRTSTAHDATLAAMPFGDPEQTDRHPNPYEVRDAHDGGSEPIRRRIEDFIPQIEEFGSTLLHGA